MPRRRRDLRCFWKLGKLCRGHWTHRRVLRQPEQRLRQSNRRGPGAHLRQRCRRLHNRHRNLFGRQLGSCTGGNGPGDEQCDGSLDDDCDTQVDEGCACTNGDTRPCGSDVGLCEFGTETCELDGQWGACSGGVDPEDEVCDGEDNDCDGTVDDGVCSSVPPVVMCPGDMSAEVLSTLGLIGSGSDPDGGPVTFQWTVTQRPTGSSSQPSSPTSATTNFYLDASGTYVLQLCVTDDEAETTCCTTELESTPPGTLHIEVLWDDPWGDVDLHLLNVTRVPDDGWFTTDDCYFANQTPDWGPAGADANPTLDVDDRDGNGPENITIDLNPSTGTYHVGTHYFCDRSAGGSGPTTATVRIFCMGTLAAEYTGVDMVNTDDWETVASVDWPSCTVHRVNDTTNGSSILPSSFTVPRHCEIPCADDNDCPAGERCAIVSGGGPPRRICILQ